MKTKIIDEDVKNQSAKVDKIHLGNAKLSESKKAIKIQIFDPEQFYVIPIAEITKNVVGKVYEYVSGEPEIVGEIFLQKEKKFYELHIKENIYYLKSTYVQLFISGSNLVLSIQEE